MKLVLDQLVGCEASSWEEQWSVSDSPCPFRLGLQVSCGGFFSKLKSLDHALMAYVETSSTPSAAFTTLAGTCFSVAAEVEGGFRPPCYSMLMETMDLYGSGTLTVTILFCIFFLMLPNIWFAFYVLVSTGLTFSCSYYCDKMLFTSDNNLALGILHLISRLFSPICITWSSFTWSFIYHFTTWPRNLVKPSATIHSQPSSCYPEQSKTVPSVISLLRSFTDPI